MKRYLSNNTAMFLAIPLGIISSYFESPILSSFALGLSSLFLKLFKLIGTPIVFFSLASSISSMEGLDDIRKIGLKLAKYTFATTIVASTISLFLFLMIEPAQPPNFANELFSSESQLETYLSFLSQIIPENLIKPFLKNNILGVAFLGIMTGLITLELPKENRLILHGLFSSLFNLISKATQYILLIIPFGIWAFTINFMHDLFAGKANLNHLMLYALCVLGSNLLQGLLILPLFLKWKGISPYHVAKNMFPAILTGFFSKSSNAALPISIRCAEKNLGLNSEITKVGFPICGVINMNGCASFILTTVLFVATSYGYQFSSIDFIVWIFLATFAAIGNAGVPMGCYFLSGAFLSNLGVPLNLLGMILPLYAFFDMVETALNLWSDSAVITVVEKELY